MYTAEQAEQGSLAAARWPLEKESFARLQAEGRDIQQQRLARPGKLQITDLQ